MKEYNYDEYSPSDKIGLLGAPSLKERLTRDIAQQDIGITRDSSRSPTPCSEETRRRLFSI